MASQREENFEQPLSLLRINGLKPTGRGSPPVKLDESDLLTIRILEASERKMRMIKELLSPEEYQSLSSDLFTSIMPPNRYQVEWTRSSGSLQPKRQDRLDFDEPKSGPPFLTSTPRHKNDIDKQRRLTQRLSKSETNLDERRLPSSTGTSSVHYRGVKGNPTMRREAIEFFFGGSTSARTDTSATNLTIELRFGYYLSPNMELEDKLIDRSGQPVSGLGYIFSLVVSFYLCVVHFLSKHYSMSSSENEPDISSRPENPVELDQQRIEKSFKKRHRIFNGSPYCAKRNINVFLKRLQRDQHFHKLIERRCPAILVDHSIQRQEMSASECLKEQLILIKTPSDRTFRLISDLNQQIIALETSYWLPRDTAIDSKLLVVAPIVDRLTRHFSRQSEKSSAQDHSHLDFGSVLLRLECLKLVDHKLVTTEEKLALKLQDEYRDYQDKLVIPINKIVARINDLATRIADREEYGTNGVEPLGDAIKLMARIFTLVEMRAKLLSKISPKQRELSTIWNELRATREDQGFNLTTVTLNLRYHSTSPVQSSTTRQGTTIDNLNKPELVRMLECLQEFSFNQQRATDNETFDKQELCLKHLKRLQKFVSSETSNVNKNHLLEVVEFMSDGAPRTSDQDCPSEELERRERLKQWLSSIGIRIALNDCYEHDVLPLLDGANYSIDKNQYFPQIDFTDSNAATELRLKRNLPTSSKLTIKLYRKEYNKYSLLPLANLIARRQKLAEVTYQVRIQQDTKEHKYELNLEVPSAEIVGGPSGEGNEIEDQTPARLVLDLSVKRSKASNAQGNQLINAQLVDQLYSILFEEAKQHGFEDTRTKASKLLNRINPRVLVALVCRIQGRGRDLQPKLDNWCYLDAHLPLFDHQQGEDLESLTSSARVRALPNARPVSLRCALLVWRWVTTAAAAASNQVSVYMSERENLQELAGVTLNKETSQLLDEFKARLRTKSAALKQAGVVGYKCIEQNRSLALDYIRQCELLIEQIIDFSKTGALIGAHETMTGVEVQQARSRADMTRDLMLEPRLKLTRPKLPNMALLMRALVPRATARRPLMPNRRRDQLPSGTSKLSQLVALSRLKKLQNNNSASSQDLEGDAMDQWRRFTGRKQSAATIRTGGNLRLVVTLQKATNVPSRLVPAHNLQPFQMQAGFLSSPLLPRMAGSSSPSYLPFAASGGRSGATSPMLVAQQQHFLAPSTTYVEAIFQRQQLASSLAQGKNPAWNETLLFGVDSDSRTDAGGQQQQQQQLADEFLHLNLYDCRTYIQDSMDTFQQVPSNDSLLVPSLAAQPQLLDANSLLFGSATNNSRQLLIPAQHQRIERHLIGSLQIPMSVLLTTSGRIEGSFTLNQPLLLEHNYQFDQNDEYNLTPTPTNQQRSAAASPRTSLSVFITLDPPVLIPQTFYLPTDSHERVDVFEYARLWERVLLQAPARNAQRQRRRLTASRSALDLSSKVQAMGGIGASVPHIRALVLRDDARYCLACRYLVAMRPPDSMLLSKAHDKESGTGPEDKDMEDRDQQPLLDDEQKMRRLARFVSLLSPLKHGLFNLRLLASSLWFDSHQLLNNSLGGHEEKGILLCNYFLHLGKCAALLLGDCIPDGRCVYVIVWSTGYNRATTTSQLELEVSELMATIGGGHSNSATEVNQQQQQQQSPLLPPVEAGDFIARLPILINSRVCQLWDPKSGACYKLSAGASQPSPHIISVGAIVTCENVYANLQSIAPTHPSEINFDIRNRDLWFPLFSAQAMPSDGTYTRESIEKLLNLVRRDQRKIVAQPNGRKQLERLDQLSRLIGRVTLGPVGSASGRHQPINYGAFSRAQCQELKESLERSIKSQLLIWRPARPTYFNRTLSRMIADKLASFEHRILCSGGDSGSVSSSRKDGTVQTDNLNVPTASLLDEGPSWWRAQLAELIRAEILDVPTLDASNETRQVISWPINLAYTSMRTILDGLYASGVHNADLIMYEQQQQQQQQQGQALGNAASTQFLVACHVEPYPARVMSVWLYVGAIVTAKNLRQTN